MLLTDKENAEEEKNKHLERKRKKETSKTNQSLWSTACIITNLNFLYSIIMAETISRDALIVQSNVKEYDAHKFECRQVSNGMGFFSVTNENKCA